VRYPGPDRWVEFFGALQERLAGAGAVHRAALTSDLPTSGDLTLEPYAPAGLVAATEWGSYTSLYRIVGPEYFVAMGVPLRSGREFTADDREGAPDVLLVDEALARTLTMQSPGPVIGRRLAVTVHEFRAGYRVTRRTGEIVGVVGTVPHEHPDAAPPGTIYMPHAQYPLWSMVVTVRGAGALPSIGTLRTALDAMDRQLPLSSVRSLRDVLNETMAPTRFLLALIGIFALAVIVLTIAGLFGLVADTVRQRRRELAVRLAVGATPGALSRRMLRGGILLASIGMLPGALLAPAVGRLLERGVAGTDGFALVPAVMATAGLLLIAAVACYIPAWRAGRIDPMRTLREE
jgi:putative ABC transport system permease protein